MGFEAVKLADNLFVKAGYGWSYNCKYPNGNVTGEMRYRWKNQIFYPENFDKTQSLASSK
jgi:hypothetical protein